MLTSYRLIMIIMSAHPQLQEPRPLQLLPWQLGRHSLGGLVRAPPGSKRQASTLVPSYLGMDRMVAKN